MILIVASSKDVASLNIKERIMANYQFKEEAGGFQGSTYFSSELAGYTVRLITLSGESVFAQDLAEAFSDLKLVVFISRHSSLSGTPTLSVHTPGNLNEAKLGGIAQTVSIAPSNAMREVLKVLMKTRMEKSLQYEVSYEGTHHGPCLNVPVMFTELGSSTAQWEDREAAEAVAQASMEAISKFKRTTSTRTTLGIGGPHYNKKFTKVALEQEVAFGHMIPKYAISTLTTDVLRQCVTKTLEKVEYVTLDWKGIKGDDKPKVLHMLDELRLPFEKI
jgi:D-aminoacyl-tRNA deacylase